MKLARVLTLLVTVVAIWFAARLELSRDLTALFPRAREADALARVTRAFGGGDVALVLVRADDPAIATRGAEAVAEELRACSAVSGVLTTMPIPEPTGGALPDPTEAWRFAGPAARERLAQAVTPEGMRERLRETRALLLAPGAGEAGEALTRDPLRLTMIPWQDRIEVAAGARNGPGGAFATDDGRARLVVLQPRGQVFESGEAARFTDQAEHALERARTRVPGVRLDLTGGHVVARQTEAMMRSDLEKSGVLSVVLASLAFALTFRRPRALIAVLPPLAMGTVWTTAIAALLYPHLSAVATAFAAVVIGVGVDTGVHVYGRLLAGRREGMSPSAAADFARRTTWRPTLGAALAAGGAFGCLAFSDIEGMRQLGILCAAGEVLTAVAILVLVPDLGALLERGVPPAAPRAGWTVALTRTRGRATIVLALVALIVAAAVGVGFPRLDHAVAALDARTLPALATYDAIYETFGGARGQLIVVSSDADPERARARGDAVAESAERLLAGHRIEGFDALARLAPSPALQRSRLAERDRLDLPSRATQLRQALLDEGFDLEGFAPALEAFAHPSPVATDVLETARSERPMLAWLRRRYLASDALGNLAVVYVRASESNPDTRAALRAADPDAVITGFADLERGLAKTLAHDLPRVLAGAFGIVFVVLALSLRRIQHVLIALAVLVVEIAIVLVLSRVLAIHWHAYDALVLPILLGITLDEVLFLLDAEKRHSIDAALAEQAPLGTATALTTAAGFAALIACRFQGLADVGKVGALGSLAGLIVAIVVIPAAFRLRPSKQSAKK